MKSGSVATGPLVDVADEHRTEDVHRLDQPTVGALDHEVVVVGHQRIRVHVDTEALVHDTEEAQEFDAVADVEEDGLACHPTIDDVVEAGAVGASWAAHVTDAAHRGVTFQFVPGTN